MKYVAYLVTACVGFAFIIEVIRQVSRQESYKIARREIAESFDGLHASAHLIQELNKVKRAE